MRNQLFNPHTIKIVSEEDGYLEVHFRLNSRLKVLLPLISDYIDSVLDNRSLISNLLKEQTKIQDARSKVELRKSFIQELSKRVDDQELALLKTAILEKLGIHTLLPSHCKPIAIAISYLTEMQISETTIKRLFGIAAYKFDVSRFTLAVMMTFVKLPDETIDAYLRGNAPIKRKVQSESSFRVLILNEKFYYIVASSAIDCSLSTSLTGRLMHVPIDKLKDSKEYLIKKERDEIFYSVYDQFTKIGKIYDLDGEYGLEDDTTISTSILGAFARMMTNRTLRSSAPVLVKKGKRSYTKLSDDDRSERPWRGDERLFSM